MYDVVIIGGGVIGCSAARELSRYNLKIAVIEKNEDVASQTSKANSGIVHGGYDPVPGTIKAITNVKGNRMFDQISKELSFSFKRIGSLVVAYSQEELPHLDELLERGKANGIEGIEIVEGQRLFEIEPNLTKDAVAALYCPSAGIVSPYQMTLAYAENARENGVEFEFNTEVLNISKDTEYFKIETDKDTFYGKYIINAAGVHADDVAALAEGHKRYNTIPRAGDYCLMDRSVDGLVKTVLFRTPSKMGKGILITPTVEGNILLGPTARDIEDKNDTACTKEGLEVVVREGKKTIPNIPINQIISSFVGIRAHIEEEDFVVEHSPVTPGLINLIGIESPGLTSAPAIALMMVDMIKEIKGELEEKESFKSTRKGITLSRDMSIEEMDERIKKDPRYGNIVCRCELVSEGEIIESIHRPLGAKSLDTVKRRVRAGMGRCQGGFCSPRIVQILSNELGQEATEITKFGDNSKILVGKNRGI